MSLETDRDNNITIKIGLPENYYSEAATIYTEAFYEKSKRLFGSQEKMKCWFKKSFNPELAIVALANDHLVGVAGIACNDRRFLKLSLPVCIEEFGFLPGLLKYLLSEIGSEIVGLHRYDRGQLLLVTVAVASNMRGMGVGTLLIEKVCEYAKQNSLNSVRLQVVDNNPKARKLYDRLGFEQTKIDRNPLLKKIIGVGAISTMVKQV